MNRRDLMAGLSAAALAGCGGADDPYFTFGGGGFIFNYRIADHYYGFVVRRQKPPPPGARLEARFELPGGGEEVQTAEIDPSRLDYMFRTPPLRGIVKGHAYRARLRVLDQAGAELAHYDKTFTTAVDQSTLPDQPLVVGPGYQTAPQ